MRAGSLRPRSARRRSRSSTGDAEALGAGDAFADAVVVGDRGPGRSGCPTRAVASVALDALLRRRPGRPRLLPRRLVPRTPATSRSLAFQAALADIRATGAALVAVSPQTPDQSLAFAEQEGPGVPRPDRTPATRWRRSYGLVYTLSSAESTCRSARRLGVELSDFNGDDPRTRCPRRRRSCIGEDGVIRFAVRLRRLPLAGRARGGPGRGAARLIPWRPPSSSGRPRRSRPRRAARRGASALAAVLANSTWFSATAIVPALSARLGPDVGRGRPGWSSRCGAVVRRLLTATVAPHTVMTTFPRARPFSHVPDGSGTSLSG